MIYDDVYELRCRPYMISREKIAPMVKHEPYSPCVCGSGKKFKFCCKGKRNV